MAEYRPLSEIKNSTQDLLFPGLLDQLRVTDDFTDLLIADALTTDRLTIKGNRLVSEGTAGYVDCDSTLVPSAVSGSTFSYDLRTINKSFSVCHIAKDQGATYLDPVEVEMKGAASAISKTLGDDVINGVYGSGEVAGLLEQTTSTVVGVSGQLLDALDVAWDTIQVKSNLVWVMNPATARKAEKEIRGQAGGMQYGDLIGTARNVPMYRGTGIARSAYVPVGTGLLLSRDEFKLFVGISDNAVGGIFNVVETGASMETKLRKLYHMYITCNSVLFNQQGSVKITNLV